MTRSEFDKINRIFWRSSTDCGKFLTKYVDLKVVISQIRRDLHTTIRSIALYGFTTTRTNAAIASAFWLVLHACGTPDDPIARNVAAPPSGDTNLYPETLFLPAGLGTFATGKTLADGTAETVPCMTCHAALPTTPAGRGSSDERLFHREITLVHGNLECLSCHDSDNRNALRLASGKTIQYSETITLCAQCHGLQHRDFTHGAHGGMNGYWDRTKGERIKNGCVVCHNPHSPKIQPVLPVLVPNDRFLEHQPANSSAESSFNKH